MPFKIYLETDLELPDMHQMVIEQNINGVPDRDRQQRCKDKPSAIRRGVPRLLVILNKALLAGKTIRFEIEE